MSSQEEKQLDDFIRNVVVDAGLEKPGPELKANIMAQLQRRYSRVVYRSLISKKGWAILAVSLVVFVILVWLNPFGVKALNIDLFPWDLSNVFGQASQTTIYAVIIFGVMMLLQLYYLKRRIDRTYRNNS